MSKLKTYNDHFEETFCQNLKPQLNDRNISTEHIATLLGAASCAQHLARSILCAFGDPVATCFDMLRGVGCCWLKFENGQIFYETFANVAWSFDQVGAIVLHPGMRSGSIFNTQHVVTRCNRVAKHVQHVAPNNVGICCVQMVRAFGRTLPMLGQQCCDDMLRSFGRGLSSALDTA